MQFSIVTIVGFLAATAAAAPAASANAAAAGANKDYILVFEKGMDTPERIVRQISATLKEFGAKINFEYHTVIKGFALTMPETAAEAVRGTSDQDFPFVLEEDQLAKTMT